MDYNVDIAEHGRNFAVIVLDDCVVKVPKRELRDEIDYIVETQNYLAKRVGGVLPCEGINDCIIMEKAPGVIAAELSGAELEKANESFEAVREECRNYGYDIRGSLETNYFWDGEQAYPS